MIEFENGFIKKAPANISADKKGNRPKNFDKIALTKTKKIKKIIEANPNLDDITDIKDYIFNT
jgi:hypothetical protein